MRNYTKQYLQGLLREYPLLEEKIALRRESLMNPDSSIVDENIGGGSSNTVSSVVESVAVKIADDELINLYERNKKDIDTTLNQSNEVAREVIRLRYFEQLRQCDVADELKTTVAVVRMCENVFLKKLARRLKLMR